MNGLTVVELAERAGTTPTFVAEWLREWRELGWVVVDEGGCWRLTAHGLETAFPLLDLRPLGDAEQGEVRRTKGAGQGKAPK